MSLLPSPGVEGRGGGGPLHAGVEGEAAAGQPQPPRGQAQGAGEESFADGGLHGRWARRQLL